MLATREEKSFTPALDIPSNWSILARRYKGFTLYPTAARNCYIFLYGMNSQLNTRVPEEAKMTLKKVAESTGIKIEDIVLDALKIYSGDADDMARMRQKLVRGALKTQKLHFSFAA